MLIIMGAKGRLKDFPRLYRSRDGMFCALGALFGGKLFISIERWYGLNQKLGHNYFLCRDKYSGIYKTHNLFSDADDLYNLLGFETKDQE